MAKGGARRRFTFRATVAAEPMAAEDLQAAERILARLIARAYAADHPELFATPQAQDDQIAGPDLHGCTRRPLTPREAGPASREGEEHESICEEPT